MFNTPTQQLWDERKDDIFRKEDCVETYNLKLEGFRREGLADDTSDQLARLFALLCVIYEGKVVIPPDGNTTTRGLCH